MNDYLSISPSVKIYISNHIRSYLETLPDKTYTYQDVSIKITYLMNFCLITKNESLYWYDKKYRELDFSNTHGYFSQYKNISSMYKSLASSVKIGLHTEPVLISEIIEIKFNFSNELFTFIYNLPNKTYSEMLYRPGLLGNDEYNIVGHYGSTKVENKTIYLGNRNILDINSTKNFLNEYEMFAQLIENFNKLYQEQGEYFKYHPNAICYRLEQTPLAEANPKDQQLKKSE